MIFDLFYKILEYNFPYIITVLGLLILDTITGLTKAFQFKNYQSSKARKIFSKLIVYVALIFAFIFIEFLLLNMDKPTFNITIILCVSMSLVELSSINENFEIITGKNYISTVVNFVIGKLKTIINNLIGKDDKNE